MQVYPYAPEDEIVQAARQGMAIARFARDTPDRPAVIAEQGGRTYGELNRRANQLARVWRRAGIRAGDAIALLMSNRAEFLDVYMAALRTGVRMTPVNWHLKADEIAYIVDNCEARTLITEERFREAAVNATRQAPRLCQRLMLTDGQAPAGFLNYDEALQAADDRDLEDPCYGRYMLYTSGTTGRPKGVLRATREPFLPSWEEGPGQIHPLEAKELLTGPAYHGAPIVSLARTLISGATVVLMDKWDAETTLKLIQDHRITHTHMVATMFHRLLQLPRSVRDSYDVSSLKVVLHGAAPTPVPVKKAMIDWFGPVLLEYYGGSEGSAGFRVTSEEWLRKPGTVGRQGPDHDNIILDDEGRPVPAGTTGTIYTRQPPEERFEYFRDPQKTAASYRGAYFTLGDMGYFDEDGYLFLTGRTAELIISGGVNIYPQEVDNELMEHDAINEVCTIGVPSEEWGEEIKSVVQLRQGYTPSADLTRDIISFARSRLGNYKCPRSIDYVDELERLPTGKIRRSQVREPYWAGRERQI